MTPARVMTWFKVRFVTTDAELYLNTLATVCERINRVDDFAIFTGLEFNDDDTGYQVIYFSPTATLECEDIVTSLSGVPWNPASANEVEDFDYYCGDRTAFERI